MGGQNGIVLYTLEVEVVEPVVEVEVEVAHGRLHSARSFAAPPVSG